MTAVDLWQVQAPRPGIDGAETYKRFDHEKNYDKFSRVSQKFFPDRIDILRMSTHDAARYVKDYSLDFVFIDADHTYEGCKRDIEDWQPKVRIGGILAGHDLNWPPVAKAVEEKFTDFAVFADNVWVKPL